MYKSFIGLFAAVLLSAGAAAQDTSSSGSSPIAEGSTPSATVELSGGAVAAGIGYVWGHGTLNFGENHHRFKLKGISVVDIGVANISATGEVYNLTTLSDFNGNYVAAAAGATVGGGVSVAYLKNEHGVVIKLHSTTAGLRFNLSADGVHITLRGK